MGRLLGRLFVSFVLFLITFIGYSSQIFIIWPWYGAELSMQLLSLLLPFNVFLGLLLWNYRLCIITDPGKVPFIWEPDTRSREGYEVKKLTGKPRYCRTCEKYKPPRAHHCRKCNVCVLRMDHHCPWVDNCIGHFNHAHFIRFLFYVDISCIYHIVMVTRRVLASMRSDYWDQPTGTEMMFIVLNYATCVPVILVVGSFSLYHFWNLIGNSTTIESWEKDRVATLVRRGSIQEMRFPYNLGIRRNIKSVLGPNPLLWCCPTVTLGTGLKYQMADGDDCETHPSWPPSDPASREYLPQDDEDGSSLVLPSTPWTYVDGSLNPALLPSNAKLRSRRRQNGVSAVPPYHPDYEEGDSHPPQHSSDDSESDYYEEPGPSSSRHRAVREGSEGYEVPPIDREELLRRYIHAQSREEGRYRTYVSEREDGTEGDSLSEADDVPLGHSQWSHSRQSPS